MSEFVELRNRIYSFCQEDGVVLLRPKAQFLSKDGNSSSGCDEDCDCENNINCHFALATHTFFSLTQTCRQIRSEFRPIYLEQTQIAVDLWDLDEGFIPIFLTPTGTSVDDVVGNLVIAIFLKEEVYYYNITPIIRLAQQAKRLNVTIAYSKDYLCSHGNDFLLLANKFFSPEESPLLHEYLQDAVEKIQLFVEPDIPSISFQLHLNEGLYDDEWMDEWARRYKCFTDPLSDWTENSMAEWVNEHRLETEIGYREPGWYIGFY